MIRIVTNVALDSLQDFTVSVSDDDPGIPAGAVVVKPCDYVCEMKRQAEFALAMFRASRKLKLVVRHRHISERAGLE